MLTEQKHANLEGENPRMSFCRTKFFNLNIRALSQMAAVQLEMTLIKQ